MLTRPKGADVYAEPQTGWKGVVHQVGFLRPDKEFDGFPVYFSGQSAVIGEGVFSEPARGWTGTIRPTARLTIKRLNGALGEAAIDGRVVAVSSYQLGSEHKCPCTATIATAARPVRRAPGTSALPATLTVSLTMALGPPRPVLRRPNAARRWRSVNPRVRPTARGGSPPRLKAPRCRSLINAEATSRAI